VVKYGILGEDDSDVDTLKAIVRKLKNDNGLKIKGEGFGGCSRLIKNGSRLLALLHEQGVRRFIVCHDADDRKADEVRREIKERVIKPAGLGSDAVHCIAVPVRTIEAWILADVESVSQKFRSWKPIEVKNPELIAKPKDMLVTMSRLGKSSPRYDPVADNHKIITYLDLERVAKKCKSFRLLQQFVLSN
jgi:hypothetical protein